MEPDVNSNVNVTIRIRPGEDHRENLEDIYCVQPDKPNVVKIQIPMLFKSKPPFPGNYYEKRLNLPFFPGSLLKKQKLLGHNQRPTLKGEI